MKTQLKKLCRIRPGHILTAFFILYMAVVGIAAIPQLVYETGRFLHWKTGYQDFIDTVDENSEDMLSFGQDQMIFLDKGTYINLNGLMAKILGQPTLNKRTLLKNGHLANLVSEPADPEDIREAANNIIRFHDAHTASGGDFLFIMVPSQISKYEDLLPVGYTDTTNDTADAFLARLDKAGVPYLDLREEMQQEGMSVTDAYFATDHHWTPQTGLWAYGKILDTLTDLGMIDPVDSLYTDPANYSFETYEDTFLGSAGKRTGIHYAGVDDSVFLRPEFETDIAISVPERELELRGRFEEVCYNTDDYHDFENPDFFLENCYGLYGWGDTKITHWRNEKAPQQRKFLLIGESFGNIPFSLMSLTFSSCDEVDRRYFEGDFAQYYDSYRPDTVIVEVNVDMTISENTLFSYLP